MFDSDALVAECLDAVGETDARRAVRDILERTLERPAEVAEVMARREGGIEVVFNSPGLTVLNVVWAPGMQLPPHDHRMWAAIGIYAGTEDNTLYRRGPERIAAAGSRDLHERDILMLGPDAIHSVRNPEQRFTGALHIYGGDFVNQPRSQWDPDSLLEEPYDFAHFQQLFAEANARWAGQFDDDLDDDVAT